MAVQALKDGVYDFLIKPFSVAELIASLGRASQKRELVIENRSLRKLHAGHINAKTALVGESMAMMLRQTLSQVAEADVDVLITGESGTGKKTAARSLHSLSHRKTKPFVQISWHPFPRKISRQKCLAAIRRKNAAPASRPETLGWAPLREPIAGRFCSTMLALCHYSNRPCFCASLKHESAGRAARQNPGFSVCAIIATSRENLRDAVQKGTFRADLFYLLSGVTLHVPPLSERHSDIRLLFQHFLFAACARTKRPIPRLTIIAHMHLQRHDWPGNVRKMERFAERFALGLDPEEDLTSISNSSPGLAERINQFEAELIQEILGRYQGDAKRSMEVLKLPRKTFYDKLSRHGIRISDYRGKK